MGVFNGCFIHRNVKIGSKVITTNKTKVNIRDGVKESCVCPHYGVHCKDCYRENK